MNVQNITPFSTAHPVGDEELVDLLADDIAADYTERMFDAAIEELGVMGDTDLQSLSADGAMDQGEGAALVDAMAADIAERSVDDHLDHVIDMRFGTPPSSVSALALQSGGQIDMLFLGKIWKGVKRAAGAVRRAIKSPLVKTLIEAGKMALPHVIKLLQASVPSGIAAQGWFSKARKVASGLISKGKKAIKRFVKDKAKHFVRKALGTVDEYIRDRIDRFSAGIPGQAPTAPTTDGADDGFFWEQDDDAGSGTDGEPGLFSASVPATRPNGAQPMPLFV